MNPTSTSRKRNSWGFSNLLDLFFPPLCVSCNERCRTKHFCLSCWSLCQPPDPMIRCKYCFDSLDGRGSLCPQCRKKRLLPIIRGYVFEKQSPAHLLGTQESVGLASFALYQWIQLEWPLPDAIVPMPDKASKQIGLAFAVMLNVPFIQAINSNYEYIEDRLEEDQTILIFDVRSDFKSLERCALSIRESFPKKAYVLSLFPS